MIAPHVAFALAGDDGEEHLGVLRPWHVDLAVGKVVGKCGEAVAEDRGRLLVGLVVIAHHVERQLATDRQRSVQLVSPAKPQDGEVAVAAVVGLCNRAAGSRNDFYIDDLGRIARTENPVRDFIHVHVSHIDPEQLMVVVELFPVELKHLALRGVVWDDTALGALDGDRRQLRWRARERTSAADAVLVAKVVEVYGDVHVRVPGEFGGPLCLSIVAFAGPNQLARLDARGQRWHQAVDAHGAGAQVAGHPGVALVLELLRIRSVLAVPIHLDIVAVLILHVEVNQPFILVRDAPVPDEPTRRGQYIVEVGIAGGHEDVAVDMHAAVGVGARACVRLHGAVAEGGELEQGHRLGLGADDHAAVSAAEIRRP